MSTIESIELHVRSYRSALKSTLEVTVNSLTNAHLKMESILHPLGNDPNHVDTSALIYSLLRLPSVIDSTTKIIIGQNLDVFTQNGFPSVNTWTQVVAPARRRNCFYHQPTNTLAIFSASITDIDDLVNILIAYQTEWNKFHTLLHHQYRTLPIFLKHLDRGDLLTDLQIDPSDWESLLFAFGPDSRLRLKHLYRHVQNLRLQQLAGSWVDFNKNTQKWWGNIIANTHRQIDLTHQDIYFVSSNSHSILNLITGFALKNQKPILDIIKKDHPNLADTWTKLQRQEIFLHPNDFLYYGSQFFYQSSSAQASYHRQLKDLKITDIPNSNYLSVDTQIIPVSALVHSRNLDPRLKITKPSTIKKSSAIILNIDYPLGFAAYNILSAILENVNGLKSIYILGKSAVLNSEIGDIQIPRLVFDEHTQNTYMFKNCFNTFFPFSNNQGSILTNQKSVSVLGTFLENGALLDKYSQNNLTVIEMETGPYLGAITEATYNQPTPQNTIVDLNSAPFDIGVINYTSDTPYSKAKNLGAGSLQLAGAEPVYLGSLAILQRIINLEESSA